MINRYDYSPNVQYIPLKMNTRNTMDKKLLEILACPVTKGKLIKVKNELWSTQAGLAYPIINDIPVMLESDARSLSQEEIESAAS